MDATVSISMVLSLRLLFWLVSCFPVLLSNPWFLSRYPWVLCQNPLLLIFHMLRTGSDQNGGWGGCGGFLWVAWMRLWPRTIFYAGVQFNLPTRFPVLDPSPAPFPTGDWRVKLHGAYASITLRPRLRFDRLPTPVLAKGVLRSTKLREYGQGFPP